MSEKVLGKCPADVKDVYIYFSKASVEEPANVKIEEDGWALNLEKSHESVADSAIIGYGVYLTGRSLYCNAALDIAVPADGVYQIVLTGTHCLNNTGLADIYVDGTYIGDFIFNGLSDSMTATEKLRTVYLTAGTHTFNFIPRQESGKTRHVGNYNYMTISELGLKWVKEMPAITGTKAEPMFLALGRTKTPSVSVTTADGFVYSTAAHAEYPADHTKQTDAYQDRYMDVTYTVTAGTDILSVNANGTVSAEAVGEADLLAEITYRDGQGNVIGTAAQKIPVQVAATDEDPLASTLAAVEIVGVWDEKRRAYDMPCFVLSVGRSGRYVAKGINGLGGELDLAGASYEWKVDSTADQEGREIKASCGVTLIGEAARELTVRADSLGKAGLSVTVTLNGVTVSSPVETLTVRRGKTGRTLYTDEMIQAARENALKYDWAAKLKDAAVQKADRYLAVGLDTLWDNVTSQDIPRGYRVGLLKDPKVYYCRYCGENMSALGNYAYVVDPLKSRWKISCPICGKSFPTNDFESFYHLGRTPENQGKFSRQTALENHRAMLIKKGLLGEEALLLTEPGDYGSAQWKTYYGYGVKGGYLYNQTCPEVGTPQSKAELSAWETCEGWGVDDGLGYDTGRIYANGGKRVHLGFEKDESEQGTREVHTYIAYYNHFATWHGAENILIVGAIQAFADAYMYTGKEEYGRAGAILLDRIADVYPDLDLLHAYTQYPNNNGGSKTGKALGRIWECFPTKIISGAYDVFFPLYSDEQVVAYLDQKAKQWGMGDGKSTPEKIRENIETGICREIFKVAKGGQMLGNFGLHQASIATAAVALDTYPDTQQMIDWLFQTSETDCLTYNTGGDVNKRLVQVVYRDGQNYESPFYNEFGITAFGDVALALERYAGYEGMSIYRHPKFLRMISSYQLMTLIRRGTKAIGDSNYAVFYSPYPSTESMKVALYYIKDKEELKEEAVKIAQHLYFKEGENLKKMHYDIFTKDPESLSADVEAIIEQYGEYDYDKSSILTGYGFGILRGGTLRESEGPSGLRDTTRDIMLNFSGHYGHNHSDLLDLGMESYGLGMTTDLGYPETPVAGDPHSNQWSQATIGHNTVVVNELGQNATPYVEIPYHFDAKDTRVKVVDAQALSAYPICDEYRRSVVMIDYDDEISYSVDFFRVAGGHDHLYTFQPNSEQQPEISANLEGKFVTQEGGTYAGAHVPFGNDPKTGGRKFAYPTGYTWMYDVDRADDPGVKEFWLDYAIKDFRNQSRNRDMDIRLRATMVNDFEADEISLVSTKPQRIKVNECIDHLEKFLIRRKGADLDTLFTTVYEPYQSGKKYIESIASAALQVSAADGAERDTDVVKALRVKINDGCGYVRYDYVIYATNRDVTYRITDRERDYSFVFRGFVGVWTVNEDNANIYSYLHDADLMGRTDTQECSRYAYKAVTGTIRDWQRALSVHNWLDVTFDAPLSAAEAKGLADRMINVERSTPGNSSFMIEDVTYDTNAEGMVVAARLDLGGITTICGYVDVMDTNKGYTYDVYENAAFTIPMSYEKISQGYYRTEK